MYIALIIVHVILCIVLIVTILLQAGRGGGLTEMAGGDTAQSVLGTQAPALLKKVTEVSAVGFIVTALVLGMVTARRGRSLFEGSSLPPVSSSQEMSLPVVPEPEASAKENVGEWPPVEPVVFPGETEKPLTEADVASTVVDVPSVDKSVEAVAEELAGAPEDIVVMSEAQDEVQEEGGR